ncbi:MAG: hypothetical protein HGA78_04545 [Nitrospirales bacterium]|nr:hypothetical protein [Nitrospirales bacterium]
MKKRIVLAMVALLLPLLSVSFSSTAGWAAEKAVVAQQNAPKVELYITSWCPYCKKAMDFFQSRGIPVTVYDIEKDSAAAARKNQLDSRRGVPFAVINGQQIHGYSEVFYQRALDGK